jgi:hypothetical protein
MATSVARVPNMINYVVPWQLRHMSVEQLINFEIFILTNIIHLKALFESLSISLLSSQHTPCVNMITVQQYIVLKARTKGHGWGGWGKIFPVYCQVIMHDFDCAGLKCMDDGLSWLFWDTKVIVTNLQRSCSSLQIGPSSLRHAIHKLGNCWRLVADWDVADWGTHGVRYRLELSITAARAL